MPKNIDITKIVRDIVDKNYPSDPFLHTVSNFSDAPGEYDESYENTRDVNDGSGRKLFMWGHSKWSDDDIIAE